MKNTFLLIVLTVILLNLSLWPKNLITPTKRFGCDHLVAPDKMIASNGELYIIETQLSHMVVFSSSGEFKMNLGAAGAGPLEFKSLECITIHDNIIYCYDGMDRRISLISQKDKKFLKYIIITNTVYGSPPGKMIVHPSNTIIMFNNGFLKEHTLLGLYAPTGKLIRRILNAYPAYQSREEFFDDLKKNKHSKSNFYKNAGYIAVANNHIFYANYIDNDVIEMDIYGKLINRFYFPLQSHEKTLKFIPFANNDNMFSVENFLTYDLKTVNNTIYILCRDNGLSYIFRLVTGNFEEVCRMKENLSMFDIVANKIYAIEDEPTDEEKGYDVLVYDLPKN